MNVQSGSKRFKTGRKRCRGLGLPNAAITSTSTRFGSATAGRPHPPGVGPLERIADLSGARFLQPA